MSLLAAVHGAHAQCAFPHPKSASKFQTSLVQAFTVCGGPACHYCTPNAATEGGVPACAPPETFAQQNGNTYTGWMWDPNSGRGQVQLTALRTGPVHPLDPPGDTTDMGITLKLTGVVNLIGSATGTGSLAFYLRGTLDDRARGDMTEVDFPINVAFTMTGGKTTVKTTVDAALNDLPQPGLPHCSSVAVLAVLVTDPNGDIFADQGIFLP